jgi:mannose-6-phosphate isomerase
MTDNTSAQQTVGAMSAAPAVTQIEGAVQHYEWGGYTFIPNLLGIGNTGKEPFAELWIGAHPGAQSIARIHGEAIPLNRMIATSPAAYLGDSTAGRFEQRLPYLLKVLDAHKMLSIQAHPSKAQAEEGFARENAAGIPLKVANRNYKDDNHKPEVHVALTDFWMLHGFRPLEEIAGVISTTPELGPILGDFGKRLERTGTDAGARKELLRSLYGSIMAMPQSEVDNLLSPLLTRLAKDRPSDKDTADYWALAAAENFPLPDGHRDRGIISIYLLNLVHLTPGQGTFQPGGMLHAYLEGVNVELMANSDNVLRGGLTPKHVDVAELMQTLTFESGPSTIISGDSISAVETVYRTPAAEFELSRIALKGGDGFDSREAHGPDAVIVMEGAATVESAGNAFDLKRGGIFFAPAGIPYSVEASQPVVLYKASVPAKPS